MDVRCGRLWAWQSCARSSDWVADSLGYRDSDIGGHTIGNRNRLGGLRSEKSGTVTRAPTRTAVVASTAEGVELRLADFESSSKREAGWGHLRGHCLFRFGSEPTLPFRGRNKRCNGPTELRDRSRCLRGTTSEQLPSVAL